MQKIYINTLHENNWIIFTDKADIERDLQLSTDLRQHKML